MIAKNIKGKSFKGCVSYVMHEGATMLEAEGVWAESNQDIIHSFAMQRSGRKEIKQPVGHIPIAFSPQDKERMTDEFMLKLAKEYMQEMGIKKTQYIVVRHHNNDNEHLHIVYNRIDNNLKLISVNNDYKRNIIVCKKLKDKYNLTYGKGKENVKREKLNDPDKVKYKIYDAIKVLLPFCKNENELQTLLKKVGIDTELKLKRTTDEIEGISFRYGNICFKGSEVDRKFSYANLKKEFQKNIEMIEEKEKRQKEVQEKQTEQPQQRAADQPKKEASWKIGGVKLTPEQMHTLKDDGYIYLENIRKKDGTNISTYMFCDDKMDKLLFSNQNPETMVKYGKYEMRLMDKMRIEAGVITHAKVQWYGYGNFAHPYLWKANPSDSEYQESWGDPRIKKEEKIEKQQDLAKNLKRNRGRKM